MLSKMYRAAPDAREVTVSIQTLAALENAIEPYRQVGYIITAQSDSAITLRPSVPKFSWWFFTLSLLLLWPVAVVYLIRFNQWRDRSVCVRLTSKGQIEVTGFTLDLLARGSRRQFPVSLARIALFLLLLGMTSGLIFIFYCSKS